MADAVAVLPIISFGLLVATFHYRLDLGLEPGHTRDWRVAWLTASVAWGLAVLLIVELSSAARLLSYTTLFACWTALAAALAVVRWGGHAGRRQLDGVTKAPRGGWLTESTLDLLLMAFVMIIMTTLAALAVIAPPNNWDSQTYHMARVAHWIQNGSVNHYPTTIARQLYLGPWSEFAVLQFQMIAGSDRWANLVQWMAMVGSAIGASLVTERLGGARAAQLCAAAVTIAIPMGILQATSTQTDYVTAFWVLTFVYYVLLMMDPGDRSAKVGCRTGWPVTRSGHRDQGHGRRLCASFRNLAASVGGSRGGAAPHCHADGRGRHRAVAQHRPRLAKLDDLRTPSGPVHRLYALLQRDPHTRGGRVERRSEHRPASTYTRGDIQPREHGFRPTIPFADRH